jgi:alpha-L-fucosidase
MSNRSLDDIDRVIAAGPFAADWASLGAYQTPDWFQEAKLGIFIHWGVYSVPAFENEWYPRNMYQAGSESFEHHVATYGPHAEFGYKDFIPSLTAERFDPMAWAELFAASGAKYVVPVAEHHDGFPMYGSQYSDWTAAKMGPRRDIIAELAAACRARGLTFGVSSHRAEHWWFFDGGRTFESDVLDARFDGLYGPARPQGEEPTREYLDDWLLRTCELIDRFDPAVLWFDWWIEQPCFADYLRKMAAYYYNRASHRGYGPVLNYKNAAFPDGTAVYDIERGQLAGIRALPWQTDTAVAKNSWGYVDGMDYKSPADIIGDLVDIVSKNGCLLLNIGPRPDGTIPDEDQRILREIGAWLTVNGEAIYSSKPWAVYGEGPTEVVEGSFHDDKRASFTSSDIRFTTRGAAVYATVLAWPTDDVVIRSLAPAAGHWHGPVGSVTLLGSDEPVRYALTDAGLVISPPKARLGEHAYVFKIETI